MDGWLNGWIDGWKTTALLKRRPEENRHRPAQQARGTLRNCNHFTEPVVNAVAMQLLQAHEGLDGHQDGGYALKSADFIAPSMVFQGRAPPSVYGFREFRSRSKSCRSPLERTGDVV